MARDLSYLYSSQPSSSQSNGNEVVERAFWQSTPTALEQLRQRTDDGCHQALVIPDDQERPEDPLCFSTQQSRLIRQTWTSSPTRTVGGVDGETRTSSHPSQRQSPGRDGAGPKTSTFAAAPDSIFRHLKNIEKVCKIVDERIQKKKTQKEWSTRMVSETARLRRNEESLEDMRRERAHPNGDGAKLDNTPATFDERLRKPRSMEEEVVPTSQSLERYLSLSPPSQTAPIGSLDASRAPNDDDILDVAPSQAPESRSDVTDVFPGSDFYSSAPDPKPLGPV